ncbi:hypothetical protein BSL78_21873 [Apostichopus japonicus]|uniref:Uncharacterized protein n=1 Tax=Stichopus japonicus TaxID=307972 RepID=A0A2G8JZV4_STIJA|nr:hypothetical protein BSL78_21873 [Apostichopus japonicus]
MTDSISFSDYRLWNCLLPSSIPVGPSLSTLKSRAVNVFWTPDTNKAGERYKLDLDSGLWQHEHDINTDAVLKYTQTF